MLAAIAFRYTLDSRFSFDDVKKSKHMFMAAERVRSFDLEFMNEICANAEKECAVIVFNYIMASIY